MYPIYLWVALALATIRITKELLEIFRLLLSNSVALFASFHLNCDSIQIKILIFYREEQLICFCEWPENPRYQISSAMMEYELYISRF